LIAGAEKAVIQKATQVGCEKVGICICETEGCKNPISSAFSGATLPGRRWMYCYGWKRTLNMVFLKSVGVYHLQTCPYCGKDLEDMLKLYAVRQR